MKHKYFCKKTVVFCLAVLALVQTVFWINQKNNAFQVQSYPLQQSPPYTVAVDAGHGGGDTGANYGVLKEVLICEQTTDELMALLEKNPNFNPIRTRKNGEGVSISERTKFVNEQRASLLLSIHCNLDPSTKQSHGFECFPLVPDRENSEKSMQFAQCLAQQMQLAGHRLRGSNGIRFAYYSGKRKLIVDAENSKPRTLKTFGILEQVGCPAVLVEQCFLSNENDRKNWANDEGCKKAALVYYKAICQYFDVEEQPKPISTAPPVFENWKK